MKKLLVSFDHRGTLDGMGFCPSRRPTNQAYQAPAPVVVQQVYNWTGFYVGVNGGYGWGNQDPFNIITNRFDSFSTGLSGGAFGGTLGAQIQAGHVVMGLEADLDWANLEGSTVASPTIGGAASCLWSTRLPISIGRAP